MALNISAEAEAHQAPTLAGRIVNTIRQAAHASHEAHLFESLAEDALDSGMHAAKLGIKRGIRRAEDFKDEAVVRVRRRPLQSVAAGFGVGVGLGVLVGWLARRPARP